EPETSKFTIIRFCKLLIYGQLRRGEICFAHFNRKRLQSPNVAVNFGDSFSLIVATLRFSVVRPDQKVVYLLLGGPGLGTTIRAPRKRHFDAGLDPLQFLRRLNLIQAFSRPNIVAIK